MQVNHRITRHIFIGIIAGGLVGLGLKHVGYHQWIIDNLANGIFDIVGQIFISAMKLIVIPLIFVSLVCGVGEIDNPRGLGTIGAKIFILYLLTTAIAISIALVTAKFIHVGQGMHLAIPAAHHVPKAQSLKEVFLDIFPTNPFKAMSEGKVLQVIVFAILFGLALTFAGERSIRIRQFFKDLDHVIMELVNMMLYLAPYGVFCLIAKLMLVIPVEQVLNLLDYFLIVLVALGIHLILTNSLLLSLIGHLNPWVFFRKMITPMFFGFSTSSSNATIPVTLKTVIEKLGVSERVAAFGIPFGATINMDGTAIMQGVATIFIANIYDIHLAFSTLATVVLTATLSSIGTAGIPSVGLVTLILVLEQAGLPTEGIAIIVGVDRLLDMCRTAVNVTGDAMVCCIVAKQEKEMDTSTYANAEA